jgi:hypothetical protein
VEEARPIARELLSLRGIFLSKLVYQTFNGYVLSQFKKNGTGFASAWNCTDNSKMRLPSPCCLSALITSAPTLSPSFCHRQRSITRHHNHPYLVFTDNPWKRVLKDLTAPNLSWGIAP